MCKFRVSLLLVTFTLLLTAFSSSVDDDVLSVIISRLSVFTENRPMEKLYLHVDKPFYAAGEDLWFKS